MAPREHLSIRLDPELKAKIEAIAEADDRVVAEMIRRLLTEAVAAREAVAQPKGRK